MRKGISLNINMILVLLLPLLLLLVGTVGYKVIEGWPLLDCFYMTVITIATVGFSEVHKMDNPGKIFTVFIILTGVVTIAYCVQFFIMNMLQKNLFGTLWRRNMDKKISALKNHVIICGYGKIGRHVSDEFLAEKKPFVVIDKEMPDREHSQEKGVLFIVGDGTDETILKEAGIDSASTIIAVVGSDAENLFITMTARGLNPKIQIVARAEDAANRNKLMRGGADKVVLPYEIGGRRIAAQVLYPSVSTFLESVMSTENLELRMSEVRVASPCNLCGKSLQEANIRKETGSVVLAIKRQSGELNHNPQPGTIMQNGDILICLGTREQIQSLEKLAGGL